MGIRVSAEEETEGLDLAEHGMHAYDGLVSVGTLGMADELASRAAQAAAPPLAETHPLGAES